MTEQPAQDAIRQRKGLSLGFILFLCALATFGGCMSAGGNGLPNVTYFLLGVIGAPIFISWTGKRFEKAKRVQFLSILCFAGLCFLIAYQSSRPAPEKIFKHIFGEPIPTSVTQMEGRKQFFDGFNWCLSFEISDEDFQSLAERCKLVSADDRYYRADETERAQRRWYQAYISGAIARSGWPEKSPSLNLRAYSGPVRNPSVDVNLLYLVHDPPTKRVWVVNVD